MVSQRNRRAASAVSTNVNPSRIPIGASAAVHDWPRTITSSMPSFRWRSGRARETTWSQEAPGEYGFYANVNPDVDHPRWSQARERRIGELTRRPTLFLNGYAEQVAGLYRGMDLRRSY